MQIYDAPIFFEKNRVFRTYRGGKLFDTFLGDGSEDSNYPEEWIASSVRALNRNSVSEKEGISRIEDSDLYFDDALRRYQKEMLGNRKQPGILVKYLDSAIRLSVQAHPDRTFATKHFQSPFGKEECWVVLATRPEACVYFGFRDGVGLRELKQAIQESETDKNALEKLLVPHKVKQGDVIFIPAKTVHAIGAGCLILEVQEPTDFTIKPERWCGDYKLSDYEMYLGLEQKTALECFCFNKEKQIKITSSLEKEWKGVKTEQLITQNQTKNFHIRRITCTNGTYPLSQSAAVLCVIQGEGVIKGDGYARAIKQGDYFFLPHHSIGKYCVDGTLTMIESFA